MSVEDGLKVDDLDRVLRRLNRWYPLAAYRQRQIQCGESLQHLPKFSPRLPCLDFYDPLPPNRRGARQLLLGQAARPPRLADHQAEIDWCVDSHAWYSELGFSPLIGSTM